MVAVTDDGDRGDPQSVHSDNGWDEEYDLGDVLNHVNTTTEAAGAVKIVIICYTGQSAAFATAILRMWGYDNAFSMKYQYVS